MDDQTRNISAGASDKNRKFYDNLYMGTRDHRPLTPGEKHRLVIDHMAMVEPIAAGYRGQKGIDFEDLVQAGFEGMVSASERFSPGRHIRFSTYATHKIHSAILDFIRGWESPDLEAQSSIFRENGDEKIYEWDAWGSFGNAAAIQERWDGLASSPEDVCISYQEMGRRRESITSAMISLTKRDRKMIFQRFLKEPPMTFESIARDNKISYARTVFLIDRALKRIRDIVASMDSAAVQ